MAEILGTKVPTLSTWERGVRLPKAGIVEKIAAMVGITATELQKENLRTDYIVHYIDENGLMTISLTPAMSKDQLADLDRLKKENELQAQLITQQREQIEFLKELVKKQIEKG